MSSSIQKLLNNNECLVYLENTKPFADANGSTHIAKIIRTFVDNDNLWYELLVLTDANGNYNSAHNTILMSNNSIVSNRLIRDIEPKFIYNFTNSEYSEDNQIRENLQKNQNSQSNRNLQINQGKLTASQFVIKSNIDKPLESTSRSALGSGIFGIYIPNETEVSLLISNPNQMVYKIDCSNCYIIQDPEHGDSITIASLHTNRYIDSIIDGLKSIKNVTHHDVSSIIKNNSIENLVTLWNIVLYRSNIFINKEWLENILIDYIFRFFTDDTLIDTINNNKIQELIINNIFINLGYTGLLADDWYNNGWDRGCVSYDYSNASILRGDTARY